MKELKDAEPSSENEKLFENEVEEEEDPSQDSSNDDDLFQGMFAIKDADDGNDLSQDLDRFGKLPEKIRKALSGFEPELLQTIPTDISENLGCTKKHVGVHGHVVIHCSSSQAGLRQVREHFAPRGNLDRAYNEGCLQQPVSLVFP